MQKVLTVCSLFELENCHAFNVLVPRFHRMASVFSLPLKQFNLEYLLEHTIYIENENELIYKLLEQ